MIPAPKNCVEQLKSDNVDKYRTFSNEVEKNNYIFLLEEELLSIKNKEVKILNNANKLYQIYSTTPNSTISLRCCKFKELEKLSTKWDNN